MISRDSSHNNPVMTINLFTLWLAWPERSVRKLVFGDEAKQIHAAL